MMALRNFITIMILAVVAQSCEKAEIIPPGNQPNYDTEVTVDLAEEADYYYSVSCVSKVILDAGVENASYSWSPGGQTTQTIELYGDFNRSFSVRVTTVDSSWVDSIFIYYEEPTALVPNAFSPNGDGVNDIFNILGSCIIKSNLKVFHNSTPKKLFESQNINVGWDGTFNGTPVPSGEYPYKAEVVFFDGQMQKFHGTVELIR